MNSKNPRNRLNQIRPGEAVPLKPVPYADTRAKLSAFLKARGDVMGWPKRHLHH